MRIFKRLSPNTPPVQEKEEKSFLQKLKLIFKQTHQRSNAIEKKRLTPTNTKSCAATASSYFHSIADGSVATGREDVDASSQNESSIIGAMRNRATGLPQNVIKVSDSCGSLVEFWELDVDNMSSRIADYVSSRIADYVSPVMHNHIKKVESSDGNSQTSEPTSTSQLDEHEPIHSLISLELDYIDFMHYGMERYSRPLRRCILSDYQHVAIFQNVEKLVTISEYHVKQMDNSSLNAEQSGERGMFLYSPSLVYVSKIHMLCEAYENYAQGLHTSNLLLHEMNKNKTFSNFVKEPTYGSIGHLSVSDFINRPVMHIHELHKTINEIFTATPPFSPDFNNLKQIVEKLSRCARIMTEPSFAEKVPDLETKASSQNGQTARTEKDTMASPRDVGSGVPVKSVDRDVARIQDRLVFSPRLQDLHLCLSERHLIYQGNTHISYKQGSWFKRQLLLFTDLLLMASERHDGSLYVSDSPISIQDLAGIEINRKHPSEFVLHLHPTSMWRQQQTSSYWSDAKVLLRALSPDEKFVWRSQLGQRVLSVTGDTLLYLSPV